MVFNPITFTLGLFPAILLAFQNGTDLLALARTTDTLIDQSLDASGGEDGWVGFDENDSSLHRIAQESNPCPVCGTGGTLTRPTGIINTPQVFRSCQEVQNNPALIPNGFCDSIQNSGIIAAECGCVNPAQTCPVCGPAGTITNPTGIINAAGVFGVCEVINNNQRIVPTASCAIIQGSTNIAVTCGCVDTTTQTCPLCGNSEFEITRPNSRISVAGTGISGTCETLNNNQRIIPAASCAAFQAAALNRDSCGCRDPLLSPVPSMSPTRTPAPSNPPPVTAFEFFFPTLFEILARIFGF